MITSALPASVRHAVLTRILLAALGVIACVVFASTSPYFLTAGNLDNLLDDFALVGIVAMPAVFLMMSGHVDLSVGASAAFIGIVLAGTAPGSGLLTAVLLSVGTGVLIGLANGLLVTVGGVDSIATTFAGMALLRGLAYLVPSGLAISLPGFRTLGNARPVLGLTVPTLIFLGIALLGWLLSRSAAGARARDIGMLPAAVRLDGRREQLWVVGLFVASGLTAALIGLIRTSQLGTGLPTAGTGVELVVVAAVLLGGGRLAGGRGSVFGTLLALLVVTIIDNGLSLANVTSYAGQVFHAALLVIALLIDRLRRRDREARRRHEHRAEGGGSAAAATKG